MPTHHLTQWGRVTHICVGNLAIIGSENGLSPGRRQAIIWTDAGILLIGPFETNFSEIWIGIQTFSLKKIHLKMSSVKWRLFCLGLNVLKSMHVSAPWQLIYYMVHDESKRILPTDSLYVRIKRTLCFWWNNYRSTFNLMLCDKCIAWHSGL